VRGVEEPSTAEGKGGEAAAGGDGGGGVTDMMKAIPKKE